MNAKREAMTIVELQIQFDLNPSNRASILENADTCRWINYGYLYHYLFVDQEDGQCYLFDENGNLDDIRKIKSIGNYTFYDCESLTSIKIPDSVKNIRYRAFESCTSLTSISIPNSVESIGDDAFAGCTSLTSISIPNSVESIGVWAFAYCTSLISIEIPNSVKFIGDCAFDTCVSLKEVVFKGKTIDEVKAMSNYPWKIKDESIIKIES